MLAVLAAAPVCVAAAIAVAAYWPADPPPPLSGPVSPVLPDLAMPALREFQGAEGGSDGDEAVFFTASIANVGGGPFVVHAARGDERDTWRVSQRFAERDGSTSEAVTPGSMIWGGHGHEHWHVHVGASYELLSLPDLELQRKYEKVGYCFFDQHAFDLSLPGAPPRAEFRKGSCADFDALELDMGLSPGWDDPYHWTLPDQRLVVSGLPDGDYRLVATADPDGWFRESDESNNETWADIRLRTSVTPPTVRVLRLGPAASPGE